MPAARSLADRLRVWPEARLAELLRARPDLATPAPHDSAQLASRAATRASLLRALDLLTHADLSVLDALVILGQTTPEEVCSLVRARPASVTTSLERLEDLAVAWSSEGRVRALTGVGDLLSVSGVRPLAGRIGIDAAAEALETLTAPAETLLRHLVDAGGEGRTSDPSGPVRDLLTAGLLLPRDGARDIVWVPGEVSIALRGGRTTTEPVDEPPEIAASERDPARVDAAAAGAAFEFARQVEALLDHWSRNPPGILRAGGLGVRELRRAAVAIGADEGTAALVVEVATAARLVAAGRDLEGVEVWAPTEAYDAWLDLGAAERCRSLAAAWLDLRRAPGLVGTRSDQDRPVNALSEGAESPFAAETRRLVLAELAALPPGRVLATGTGVPSLVARLGWLRPRRPRQRDELVVHGVREAARLGLIGLGGLSTYGRALVSDDADDADAAAALAPLMPAPVTQVLIQADLTAVATGPLERQSAARLHEIADVESRGGATVYRFSAASVRRAFDAGWTAIEAHDFVSGVSATPVPQPLDYLIDDTARSFGRLRVGTAEAFLRVDDPDVLTELLAEPASAGLGLRRLAPTVLVSDLPIDLLVPRLHEIGWAPALEAADGSLHVMRGRRLRVRAPKATPAGLVAARAHSQLWQAVRAVRAGDEAAAQRPSSAHATTPAGAMTALRGAVEAGEPVVIGYVDNHGSTAERPVDPRRVEGGRLTAYDRRAGAEREFAVHRITSVRPLA